jgi:Flp pilus assembly protein TadB
MSGFVASILLTAAFLLLAFSLTAARSQNPPAWLVTGFTGEAVSLAIVGALFFGIGYLLHFVATITTQAMLPLQAAAVLSAPLLSWLLWRHMQRWKRVADALTESLTLPTGQASGGTPDRPVRPRGGWRKAT